MVWGLERACTGGQHGTCSAELWKESLWRTVGRALHAVPLGKPDCPPTDQVVPPIRPWEIDWGDSYSIWYHHLIQDIKHESFQPSLHSTWLNNRDQSRQWLHVSCSPPAYDCQPGSLRHPLIVSPIVIFTRVRALNLDQHLSLILRWSNGNRGSVSKSMCLAAHFPHTQITSQSLCRHASGLAKVCKHNTVP